MKKNSFVEGTIIASLSLIFIKILGALYVIPFYSIVGELGGALYSYGYMIYTFVLNICTAGIPVAISKIVSEYTTLEMYEAKERTLKLGNKIIIIASSILFLTLFIFAREIGLLFIGSATGGNTIEEIELVIRCVSFCLLIIPLYAVKKGYLQGHKFISVTTTSQIIEQVVRIAVILLGSYIVINLFNQSVSYGVAVAMFGAFIAGVVAYLYLEVKIQKNKKDLNIYKNVKKDDVSDKSIFKKIVVFSLPLIITSMVYDLYNVTDLSLIIRTLTSIGYSGAVAETIGSVITTWASKICLIVNAIAVGLGISLIPHMVSYYVKKDYKSINDQFNKALGISIVIGLPLSIGISLLSREIYTMFYGYSEYGTVILRVLPYALFMTNLSHIVNMVLQALNKFKTIYFSAASGLLANAILDVPLILLFNKLGLYPFYGAILATFIGGVFSFGISLNRFKKDMNFNFKTLLNVLRKMIIPLIFLVTVVLISLRFLNNMFNTRLTMSLTCLICGLLGASVYFIIVYKNNLLYDVFGKDYIDNILNKFKRKNR